MTALTSMLPKRRRTPRRIEPLQQLSTVECGPTCLAMILTCFGRDTSVAECRDALGVGRDGVNARALMEGARSFGLVAQAYSIEAAGFESLPLPAIAHWGFSHFVVVESCSKRRIVIVDPSEGRRTLRPEEFARQYTGVALTFTPGPDFERKSRGVPAWRRYLRSVLAVAGAKGTLAQIVGASVALQVVGLAFPLLTKVVVDRLLPGGTPGLLPLLLAGMVVVGLAQLVVSYMRSFLMLLLRARVDTQLMRAFMSHLLSLPLPFFQQRNTGDLLMRLGSNATIRETLTNQTLSVVLDGSLVIVYLAILLSQAPLFGALTAGLGLVHLAILLATKDRIRDLMRQDVSARATEQAYLVEIMKGVLTLKATGSEERAFARWADLFLSHTGHALRRGTTSAAIEAALGFVRVLSPMALLWLGAVLVLRGELTVGTMLALNALAASFLAPLMSIVGHVAQFQTVGAHLARVEDVLSAEPEQRDGERRTPASIEGRIELRNVSFRYDRSAPAIFEGISLSIAPGQKVAIVGPTGCGKSTLALLLLGLVRPTSGQVLVDGIPLESLDLRALRRRFGVVLQDPALFSGSIRQNITLNAPEAALDDVVEAARLAAIDEDVARMPMGYDTMLAEGASNLSGGQRQRLALARAVVSRPSFLLLDEATSHLDVRTEERVHRNLARLSCTRVVIAHRLSTVRDADVIVVLGGGRVVEQGTHDELVAAGGFYSSLVDAGRPPAAALRAVAVR